MARLIGWGPNRAQTVRRTGSSKFFQKKIGLSPGRWQDRISSGYLNSIRCRISDKIDSFAPVAARHALVSNGNKRMARFGVWRSRRLGLLAPAESREVGAGFRLSKGAAVYTQPKWFWRC